MTSKKLDLLEQLKLQQKELTEEIEQEIKQDLNQETHLLKYLQDVNGENIQSTTCHINSIYEEIIEINHAINLTAFISINDLPEIRKESRDRKKRAKLINDLEDYRNSHLEYSREVKNQSSKNIIKKYKN